MTSDIGSFIGGWKARPIARRTLSAFACDSSGAVYIWFAGGLIGMLGLAAIAVDTGYLYMLRSKAQITADAAALAGAAELPDESAVRTMAQQYASLNMPAAAHETVLADDDVAIGNWDVGNKEFTKGGSPANAVQVTVRRSETNGNAARTFFGRALGFDSVDIVTSAVAMGSTAWPYCVLALDPTGMKALDTGNATIEANNCAVHVNSSDPENAIAGNPQGNLIADDICVNGGYSPGPTIAPDPQTGCAPISDPLTNWEPPSQAGCDYTNFEVNGGSHTLSPGVYCGGIQAKGGAEITFQSGDYVMSDGPLLATGGSSFDGDGVSFSLMGNDAIINMSGAGDANLSAPTDGATAGMLFYADRTQPNSTDHRIRGGSGINLEGLVYFPSSNLMFDGNATGESTAPYTVFIGRQLKYDGGGEVVFNSDFGSSDVPLPFSGQRLVR